ncbi:hypothetical protein [Geobacter sp.]|uniref:hypothetical protein n=1 Tax=Geobacter sp. TaxID=46610 RepID=UPI0027BA1F3E|nr:hypothetical protein [Geobacter sp.]
MGVDHAEVLPIQFTSSSAGWPETLLLPIVDDQFYVHRIHGSDAVKVIVMTGVVGEMAVKAIEADLVYDGGDGDDDAQAFEGDGHGVPQQKLLIVSWMSCFLASI